MLTLKHFMIFKEVARVKSMSKAAENLYISQPTVSQKIQEIEDYYHIKLFQRYSKTLGISQEGQIFLEHVNKVMKEVDEIDELFFTKRDSINLRVGSTLTVASTLAPMLFEDIKQKNPNLRLQIYVDNTQKIENLILENEIDIALVEGDIHNDAIVHEPIIHDRLVLVCNKEHPLASYDFIDVSQLKNQSFILREKGSGTRSLFEQFMNNHKIPYHVAWQCHSWDSIKQAVLYNHGITLISVRLVEREIDEGIFHVLNIQDVTWSRMFSLCYHANKIWNDNLELFRQELLNYEYCPIIELLKLKKEKNKKLNHQFLIFSIIHS